MDLDAPICLCFDVSRRKIIRFIKVEKPRRASQLSECFGAGTGCGWCRPILERLNQQHSTVAKSASGSAYDPAIGKSAPDLASEAAADQPNSELAAPAEQIDQALDSLDPLQYQADRQAYRDQKRAESLRTDVSDRPSGDDPQNPVS